MPPPMVPMGLRAQPRRAGKPCAWIVLNLQDASADAMAGEEPWARAGMGYA